jgi:CheY-like chemotaxis protein
MGGRRPLVLCIGIQSEWSRRKALLEHHGYDVVAVTNEAEGLFVLRKHPVDAVILAVEVGGKGGGAIVRRVKNTKSHIPLLVLLSPLTRIHSGKFPTADAVMSTTDTTSRVVEVLANLLDVKFPFFTRWFGNWKCRAGA